MKDSSHRDRTTWLMQRVRGKVGGPDPAKRPHGRWGLESLRPVGSQGRNRLDLAAMGHCAVLWEGRQESVVAGGRPRLPLLGMRNKTQAG